MFVAICLVLLATCVVFEVAGVHDVAELGHGLDEILSGALAVFALLMLARIPQVSRRIMEVPSAEGVSPSALQTVAIASMSLVITSAVTGMLVGLLWRGFGGIPFEVAALIGMFAMRPQWDAWDAQLRLAQLLQTPQGQ